MLLLDELGFDGQQLDVHKSSSARDRIADPRDVQTDQRRVQRRHGTRLVGRPYVGEQFGGGHDHSAATVVATRLDLNLRVTQPVFEV
jgi:hypothetical protein